MSADIRVAWERLPAPMRKMVDDVRLPLYEAYGFGDTVMPHARTATRAYFHAYGMAHAHTVARLLGAGFVRRA